MKWFNFLPFWNLKEFLNFLKEKCCVDSMEGCSLKFFWISMIHSFNLRNSDKWEVKWQIWSKIVKIIPQKMSEVLMQDLQIPFESTISSGVNYRNQFLVFRKWTSLYLKLRWLGIGQILLLIIAILLPLVVLSFPKDHSYLYLRWSRSM